MEGSKKESPQLVIGIWSPVEGPQEACNEAEGQTQPAEEDDGRLDIVIRGDVARVVLKNALETVADSPAFRVKLLKVLQEVSLPASKTLAADLYQDLEVGHQDQSGFHINAFKHIVPPETSYI